MASQQVVELRCRLPHLRLREPNLVRNCVEANSEVQCTAGTLSAAPACMRRDAVGARNRIYGDPVQCAQEAPLLVLAPKAAGLHRLLPVHHRIGFAAVASH